MADDHHVIDIILRARDDTAAGLASATAHLKEFEKVTEDSTRQNEQFRRSFANLQKEISANDVEMRKLQESVNRAKAINVQTAGSISNLESASRNLTRALSDQNATRADQKKAEADYNQALTAANESLKTYTSISKERRAELIQQVSTLAKLVQATDELRSVQQELNKVEAKSAADRKKANDEFLTGARKRLEAIQKSTKAEIDAENEVFKTREDRQKKYLEDAAERLEATKRANKAELDAENELFDAQRKRQTLFLAAAQKRLAEIQKANQAELAHENEIAALEKKRQDAFLQASHKRLADIQQANRAELEHENEMFSAQQKRQNQYLADSRARLEAVRRANRAELEHENEMAKMAADRQNKFLADARARLAATERANRAALADEYEVSRQRERQLTLGRQYIEQVQKIQQIREASRKAGDTGDQIERVRLEFDEADAVAKAQKLSAEITTVLQTIHDVPIDINDKEAMAHAVAFRESVSQLLKGVKLDVDFDVDLADVAKINALAAAVDNVERSAGNAGGRIGFLRGLVTSLGDGFDRSSGRIASFDNFLRGLMSLGIALFLNQLILLAGALAGSLAALASSAAYAGATLGGAFTAGMMQALPVLGLFGAGLLRLKAVFDAVSQAQLLQQQQSYQGAQQARQQANASDAVVSANERVKAATEAVTEAQNRLNDSREEARRKLLELILQERGLQLSLDQNTASQRAAVTRGDTAALPGLFLARQQTQAQLGGVRADISQRTTGTAPEISSAQRGLDQAKRSAAEAGRALDRAKGQAEDAAAGVTAAAGTLDFLLSRMSGAERRLYETLKRLQDEFRKASQFVTEPLINAFNDALLKIEKLIGDRKILNSFRGLAEEMATQGTRIFDTFTSPEMISTFLGFIEEAKKNLAPFTDIIINLGKAFVNIGVAAGPALTQILEWFSDITKKVSDFFEAGRKTGDLENFFANGLVHLKAWGDLLWQILRLFGAIAGPGGGARTGLQLVRDMAEAIGSWADKISTPGTKLNEFFNRFFKLSRQMIEAMQPVLRSIADEFDKTFSKDGLSAVQGFATFLADVLIPAVGDFARTLGRITARIGEFVKHNPEIATMAASFLSAVLVFGVLQKVLTIFGPIISVFRFLGKYLADALGVTEKLLGPMVQGARAGGLLAQALRAAAGFIIGPWGIAIGIFVLLAIKLGLLHDLVDALKKPFVELWKQVEPPLGRLMKSFQHLWDALGEGKGAFAALTPVLKFLIGVIGDVLGGIGKAIGLVLGGVIDVLSGLIDLIVGLLTGDWGMAWDGFKRIVVGAARAVLGIVELVLFRGMGKVFGLILKLIGGAGKWIFTELPGFFLKAIVEVLKLFPRLVRGAGKLLGDLIFAIRNGLPALEIFFRRIGRTVFDAISSGFSRVFTFFKNLPGRLWELVKDVGTKIASAFSDIGAKIMSAITKGIRDPKGAAKDFANGLIDLINTLIPNKIGPINLPDNPIPRFATGGRVGRGYGGGDRQLILAEAGEWVIRKESVAALGEGFMALINQGWGTTGNRKAVGGPVRQGAGDMLIAATTQVDAGADIQGQAHRWREMLQEMVDSTRRNTNAIEEQFRDLRVNVTATMKRMYTDVRDYVAAIQNSFSERGQAISEGWGNTFSSIQEVVYSGLKYIANSTNDALKALGDKGIDFSLSRPSGTTNLGGVTTSTDHAPGGRFAGGGMVGNSGERGRDAVPAWLGRGEAVLNYAHQRLVNPALQAMYGFGLPDLFRRVRGYHAGGMGALGFASGGFTGPGGSGEGFTPVWNMAKSKFGMTNFTGHDGHSQMTSSGNVSDHWYRRALDMSNGVLTAQEDALSSFFKNKVPQVVKQLIWRNKDQFKGFPVGGHEDHVHLAMFDRFAFNSSLMARILSRAMRGLSIADLTAGFEGGSALVDHVDAPGVKGPGPLRRFAAKLLSRVTRAANAAIDKVASVLLPGSNQFGYHGEPYDGPLDKIFPAHHTGDAAGHVQLTPAQVAALASRAGLPGTTFEQIAHGESNYYPGIISNDGGYGLWQMTPRVWGPAALAYMNSLGGVNAMLNPWKNAQMARYLYDAAGQSIAPWYGTQFVTGRAQGGFAGSFDVGGQVPGGAGRPVPIIAHEGEWIVNPRQQSRLAGLLATTTGKLRDFLGFRGGPTEFADGGVVRLRGRATRQGDYQAPVINPEDLAGIEREINTVFEAISNISKKGKIGKAIDKFVDAIRNLTDQDGFLDVMATELEELGVRLGNRLALAQVGLRRVRGRFVKLAGPMTDAVKIADQTVDNTAKIGEGLRDMARIAGRGLQQVNARLEQLRKGGISSKEEEQYKTLLAARAKFQQTLTDLDDKYAQNRADLFDAQVNRFNAQTEQALGKNTLRAKFADLASKVAAAFGDEDKITAAGNEQLGVLQQQQTILGQRYKEATAKAGKDPRWQKTADDLRDQLLALSGNIATQIAANNKAAIEAINNTAGRATSVNALKVRVAQALGHTGDMPGLVQGQIDILRKQQADLQNALKDIDPRNVGLIQQVKDQIEELGVTITEKTAEMLQTQIDLVNKTAASAQRRVDLANRANDLLERGGDRLGAAAARIGTSRAQTGVFRDQLEALRPLLAAASAAGNTAQVESLTAQMEDLQASIDEQVQATQDLTFQYRQTATDIITGRQSRATGLIGTAASIMTTVGNIAGSQNTGALLAFAQQIRDALTTGAQQIRDNITSAINDPSGAFGGEGNGILAQLRDAFTAGPGSFATTLATLGPAIADLESTMTDTEKAAFQALIQSMIDNTTAVLDNTQQIDTLNGTMANPQGFQSSAWQWFRTAIFTGMGNVLPTFEIPQMHNGGEVTRAGVFDLQVGERVTKPGQHGAKVDITVNEAGGPVDTEWLASRIGFELKNK